MIAVTAVRTWELDRTPDLVDLVSAARDGGHEVLLVERCGAFRGVARAMVDWPRVAVVSHWGFIRGLTGRELRNGELIRFDPHAAD